MSIVVVGSINADLGVRVARHPRPGETLLGSDVVISPGGKGANQAVAAALVGADVSFVGAVGVDAYADPAMRMLRSSGVDVSRVAEVESSTGLALIAVDDRGENTIIVVPGANALVDGDFVRSRLPQLRQQDVVLLQGEIPPSGFVAAVEAAVACGARVVVNLAPVVDVDRGCLLRADPLMVNEHEAALVLVQLGVSPVPDSFAGMAQALLDVGFRSVILTLGADGALVADAGGIIPVATPVVEVVDTTGAGDAFAGACVAALDRGELLVDAARFAVRVGAFAVTGLGAQESYPQVGDELPAV
ncbi:ribokinase [Corynebacterium felinum]|uniref:Ribokinase n=1 Tax=Corynebacterium felinum TaxID=131318 RepID=A0ABU2B8B3_9CORY|nr:ribokinase [Corynebacterium felinum]MDF5820218.1 ribokinase [Corynebacterium felinum]MDR7354858.1 ribokinase [Corynebacterium felinum]WJY94218.1 Ribokinase [Corynebacterium felinum]